MNKKYILLLGILLVVLVVGSIGLAFNYSATSNSSEVSKSDSNEQLVLKFSDLQADHPKNPETCLATNDNPNITLDSEDQTGIVNAAIGTVIDIPAGTSVDVYIKSHDKTNTTGTSIYESTYGKYNFTAKKDSKQGSWIVTRFIACK